MSGSQENFEKIINNNNNNSNDDLNDNIDPDYYSSLPGRELQLLIQMYIPFWLLKVPFLNPEPKVKESKEHADFIKKYPHFYIKADGSLKVNFGNNNKFLNERVDALKQRLGITDENALLTTETLHKIKKELHNLQNKVEVELKISSKHFVELRHQTIQFSGKDINPICRKAISEIKHHGEVKLQSVTLDKDKDALYTKVKNQLTIIESNIAFKIAINAAIDANIAAHDSSRKITTENIPNFAEFNYELKNAITTGLQPTNKQLNDDTNYVTYLKSKKSFLNTLLKTDDFFINMLQELQHHEKSYSTLRSQFIISLSELGFVGNIKTNNTEPAFFSKLEDLTKEIEENIRECEGIKHKIDFPIDVSLKIKTLKDIIFIFNALPFFAPQGIPLNFIQSLLNLASVLAANLLVMLLKLEQELNERLKPLTKADDSKKATLIRAQLSALRTFGIDESLNKVISTIKEQQKKIDPGFLIESRDKKKHIKQAALEEANKASREVREERELVLAQAQESLTSKELKKFQQLLEKEKLSQKETKEMANLNQKIEISREKKTQNNSNQQNLNNNSNLDHFQSLDSLDSTSDRHLPDEKRSQNFNSDNIINESPLSNLLNNNSSPPENKNAKLELLTDEEKATLKEKITKLLKEGSLKVCGITLLTDETKEKLSQLFYKQDLTAEDKKYFDNTKISFENALAANKEDSNFSAAWHEAISELNEDKQSPISKQSKSSSRSSFLSSFLSSGSKKEEKNKKISKSEITPQPQPNSDFSSITIENQPESTTALSLDESNNLKDRIQNFLSLYEGFLTSEVKQKLQSQFKQKKPLTQDDLESFNKSEKGFNDWAEKQTNNTKLVKARENALKSQYQTPRVPRLEASEQNDDAQLKIIIRDLIARAISLFPENEQEKLKTKLKKFLTKETLSEKEKTRIQKIDAQYREYVKNKPIYEPKVDISPIAHNPGPPNNSKTKASDSNTKVAPSYSPPPMPSFGPPTLSNTSMPSAQSSVPLIPSTPPALPMTPPPPLVNNSNASNGSSSVPPSMPSVPPPQQLPSMAPPQVPTTPPPVATKSSLEPDDAIGGNSKWKHIKLSEFKIISPKQTDEKAIEITREELIQERIEAINNGKFKNAAYLAVIQIHISNDRKLALEVNNNQPFTASDQTNVMPPLSGDTPDLNKNSDADNTSKSSDLSPEAPQPSPSDELIGSLKAAMRLRQRSILTPHKKKLEQPVDDEINADPESGNLSEAVKTPLMPAPIPKEQTQSNNNNNNNQNSSSEKEEPSQGVNKTPDFQQYIKNQTIRKKFLSAFKTNVFGQNVSQFIKDVTSWDSVQGKKLSDLNKKKSLSFSEQKIIADIVEQYHTAKASKNNSILSKNDKSDDFSLTISSLVDAPQTSFNNHQPSVNPTQMIENNDLENLFVDRWLTPEETIEFKLKVFGEKAKANEFINNIYEWDNSKGLELRTNYNLKKFNSTTQRAIIDTVKEYNARPLAQEPAPQSTLSSVIFVSDSSAPETTRHSPPRNEISIEELLKSFSPEKLPPLPAIPSSEQSDFSDIFPSSVFGDGKTISGDIQPSHNYPSLNSLDFLAGTPSTKNEKPEGNSQSSNSMFYSSTSSLLFSSTGQPGSAAGINNNSFSNIEVVSKGDNRSNSVLASSFPLLPAPTPQRGANNPLHEAAKKLVDAIMTSVEGKLQKFAKKKGIHTNFTNFKTIELKPLESSLENNDIDTLKTQLESLEQQGNGPGTGSKKVNEWFVELINSEGYKTLKGAFLSALENQSSFSRTS